jgi:fibronectin type 3 domain-containing protein
MAYDSESDRTILFGGTDGTFDLNDTTSYDFNADAWTAPLPTPRPSPRVGPAMAYDSESDRTVLVGGLGSDGDPLDDTWSLNVDGATWTNLTSGTRPPAGDGAAMAYHARSDLVILYRSGQTWSYDYDTNTWTDLAPLASPTTETYHGMAYDFESNRTLLFGGSATGPGDLDETWAYDLENNTWTSLNPLNHPAALSAHSMVYDAQSDRIILFGGSRTAGPSDETWSYDYDTNTWTDLTPTSRPSARSSSGMAYDSESDVVVLFGGVDAAGVNGETWSYDFEANAWLDMGPLNSPPPRGFHAVAYDSQSDLIVLFGGSDDSGYPDDTWVYRSFTAPSAPTDLVATPGNGQVGLSWQPPANDGGSAVSGYRVYRGLSSGTESLLVELGDVLTYTDTGLTNGVTYYYQVSALNGIGEGPRSLEVAATPATAPDAPANLVATPGDAVVVLGWDPPPSDGGSPITGYRIYRGTSSGGETLLATLGAVLTYTDSAVTNDVTYYYQVSAENAFGEGPRSLEVSATPTPAPTAPSAPQNLQAAPGDTVVTLTWDPPASTGNSAITNYRIYRGTVSGSLSLHDTVGDVLTYTDTGLTNQVTYYYQVSAVNAVGEGPRSAEVSATPALLPSAPQSLQAAAGNGLVSLTWQPPASDGGSPIIGYSVYRGTAPGGALFLATVGPILSYTDFGVSNGVTYYYQVAAVNAVGEGPRSAEVSATPASGATVPSAPRNLVATPGDGQVGLTWAAPATSGGSAITNYWVYRGTTSGDLALHATLGDVLAYTDTTVTNGVTYYYQVSAVNSIGEGSRSPEVSATPGTVSDTTDPTITITSPQAGSTVTSGAVTVSGTAADDVALARVEISSDGTSWILATGTTSWSGTLTLGEGSHTIYARATDTSGNTGTTTVTVTVSSAAPVGGLVLPLELLLAILVIGAVVVAVTWAAARRRRRPGR